MHLATFWAKKIDKTGEVGESPATIYLVKSSGVAEEYVPVERYIVKTSAIATAAIKELLIGPSLAEKNSGLFSALPLGSELNSLKIENGVAYADFNQQTQSGGGSTSMFLRRDQIGKTLKQFPSIKSVVLSIDGNSRQDLIFQP
ncbi:MAG TPA: GerMN domain-containing protein [Candidatus Paceibacterota bacterium]